MNLYRLNLNLLVALDVLLLEQSVTRAAQKLFITQAAMSNNLQNLRDLFKDDLLIREKNRMVLSSYAQELQPKLHQVLQEMRSLVECGQRFEAETSQRIFKIGLSDYTAALFMPKLIAKIQKQAPQVKLVVVSLNHLSNSEGFEKGDYDMGIGKAFKVMSPIQKKLLFKDTGVCIMNHNHALAKKPKITLKDYLANKHIAVRSETPHFPPIIEQSLAKLGHKRNIQISLPFIIPIFKLIELSEHLIATVIKSMALSYKQNHSFLIKELPFEIPSVDFFLAWHQRHDKDLGHQWLREQIIEIAAEMMGN